MRTAPATTPNELVTRGAINTAKHAEAALAANPQIRMVQYTSIESTLHSNVDDIVLFGLSYISVCRSGLALCKESCPGGACIGQLWSSSTAPR